MKAPASNPGNNTETQHKCTCHNKTLAFRNMTTFPLHDFARSISETACFIFLRTTTTTTTTTATTIYLVLFRHLIFFTNLQDY